MKGQTLRSRFLETCARCSRLLMLLVLAGCTTPVTITSQLASVATSTSRPDASAVALDSATATSAPQPTPADTTGSTPRPVPAVAPSPPPAPIAGTLVLYTTTVTDTSGQAYWAFRTFPPLPRLDATAFDTLYGLNNGSNDFSLFFADFRPQPSPDGQTLLVPGLRGHPEYGVEATGTWLIDLATGATRQLLPDSVIATWNPSGDAITYVDGDTLFTLDVAAGATPQPLFQHPDLWGIYAKWSADGQWIAAVTGEEHEPMGEAQTNLTFTYRLVPAGGGPARELAQRETYGADYSAGEMSWSPDGQFLLIHNHVYDPAGNALLPDGMGGLEWLPDRSQLLYRSPEGLRVITATGEEVALVEGSNIEGPMAWGCSRDGRRLAFSLSPANDAIPLAIYDLDRGETKIVGAIPGALRINQLRWSADGAMLLAEADHGEGQYDIWSLPAVPGSAAERLIADAVLIEAIPYP